MTDYRVDEMDYMVDVSMHMYAETRDRRHLMDAMYWKGEIDNYWADKEDADETR